MALIVFCFLLKIKKKNVFFIFKQLNSNNECHRYLNHQQKVKKKRRCRGYFLKFRSFFSLFLYIRCGGIDKQFAAHYAEFKRGISSGNQTKKKIFFSKMLRAFCQLVNLSKQTDHYQTTTTFDDEINNNNELTDLQNKKLVRTMKINTEIKSRWIFFTVQLIMESSNPINTVVNHQMNQLWRELKKTPKTIKRDR